MAKKEREYIVETVLTISVHTRVKATSKRKALKKAFSRDVTGLTIGAEDSTDEEAWVTSGELDGTPSLEEAKVVRALRDE